MPRAIRYLIGFCVAAYGTHRLIPLLEQSDYLRIPVGWSSLEVTILGTLLLAVVFQAVYCVKENDQTRHKFDLAVSVLVGFLFAGAIGCLAVYYLDGPRWLTKMVASVSTILGVMLYFGTLWFDHKSRDDHKRGRRLISFSDAKKIAQHYLVANEKTVFWGFLQLPAWVATSHFSVTGATGSGKTIILRLLMQSVLPGITRGNDSRALIYDAKQDMLSILTGICPKQRIVLLNPFDERGAAWDMAADISSPATAQQVAAILIPEEKHTSQPFFADAARHLLAGVMISFIRNSPENWIFRDVIFAMKSGDRLKEVLSRDESTRDLLEYFKNELTAQNIMSTVATKLQRYEFIAAAWSHATEKISLKQWVEEESILVLGNDEATRTALDAINQVIFKRVTELVLDQSESTTRRTWFFLDEVREAGRLEGLGRLLTKGRSKGACVVLGYQDIEGLREVYGHQTAAEITGQCSNKAILRTDSPETAKWGASLFGDQEILERSTSSTCLLYTSDAADE